MADEVDRLEVVVEAQASKANKQLDSLVTKLDKMSGSLSKLNSSGLTGLANSVSKLSTAMQGMNNVKTTDFTRLAKNIEKLGSLNTANFYQSASAINTMAKAYANLGKSVSGVGNLTSVKAPTVKAAKVTASSTGASTLGTVSSQASKASNSLKSLSGRLSEYSSYTNSAINSSKSFAYHLGKLYANYYLLIRATKGLGNALMSSMDYIEQYNYFNVTLGKVASEWSKDYAQYGYDSAKAYGDSFKDRLTDTMSKMTGFQMNDNGTLTATNVNSLGLDATALTNYSAGLMQVTNSLKLTGEASTATAKAMTMLSGDMSSFRNVDLKTVQTNFQSGLIGQSRALYKYGIDITNATLQQYAYGLGIEKSITAMTQGEKMQLRMIAILDQSKAAYGDLANTINAPANQVRLLKNNFAALSRTIGNMFLPMVARVLPYVNGLVISIRRLFEWTASLMGIDLSSVISNSSAGYSDAFADLADDADNASDAINGTSDSAKDLKNQLMGFDEINKLSDSTSGSSSAAAGTGPTLDLTDQLTGALADYQTVWDNAFNGMNNTANKYADGIVGFFKSIAKYAEPSVDAVKHLWDDGLSKFGNFSYDAATGFLDNFLVPLGKWTLGKGFPQLVDATNDFFNDIDWNKLSRQLNTFWKAIEPFAEGVGQGMIDYFKGMTTVGSATIKGIGAALEAFGKVLDFFPPSVVKAVGEALGALIMTIATFKTLMGVASIIEGLGASMSKFMLLIAAHPYIALAAGIAAVALAITGLVSSSKGVDVLNDITNSFNDTINGGKAEAETMSKLADEYANLMGKAELSNNERLRAQSISKILVDAYPELKKYYDDSSKLLLTERDNISKVIDEKLKEIKLKAYQDKLIELEKKKIELTDNLANAEKNQIKIAQDGMYYARQATSDVKDLGYVTDLLSGKVASNTWKFNEANKEVEKYKTQLDAVEKELGSAQIKFTELSSGIDDATNATRNNGNQAEASSQQAASASANASASMQNDYSQVVNKANISTSTIANAFNSVASSLASAGFNAKTSFLNNLDPDGIGARAYDAVNGIRNAFASLDLQAFGAHAGDTFVESLRQSLQGTEIQLSPQVSTGNLALNLSRISMRAGGGFPDMGEVFIAREAGPEMVGNIGGRTAVANNSQIEGGIASAVGPAVYEAVVMAMNSGGSNGKQPMTVNCNVILDGRVMANVVTNAQQHNDRIFNAVATV